MSRVLIALALALSLPAPSEAEPLAGSDDPALRAALTSLLARDDPAAVATLRDLAETGNTAAVVSLPFALQWVPPQGSLKEKNAQRQVGGLAAQEAASRSHRATALWDQGRIDDVGGILERSSALQALGEPGKAAILLSGWLNQTGATLGVPPELLSDDAPAMLGAYALTYFLRDSVYRNEPAAEAGALLLRLMREDSLVGWTAFVHILETSPEIFEAIGSPLAGTGLSAADTERRIAEARAVRAVSFPAGETPITADTAVRAHTALIGRSEFLPISWLCGVRCPDSSTACEVASLAYSGLPFGFAAAQPFADVIDPIEFAASDRGLATMIPLRNDPAAAADRTTAEGLDACYAEVLAHRDTLGFGE